jgi:phospholipase D1/2
MGSVDTSNSKALRDYQAASENESDKAIGCTTENCPLYATTTDHALKLYNDGSTDAKGTDGAFHDMVAAIKDAKHLVFVVDWSFHPLFNPVRTGRPSAKNSIGAILLQVANQNADLVVAIHTWDHSSYGAPDPLNDDGEDILSGLAKELGFKRPKNFYWRASSRLGVGWSHHQKFVVCDVQVGPKQKRELRVFFGGLDFTKGRFDWPAHHVGRADQAIQGLKTSWSVTIPGIFTDSTVTTNEWYNAEFGDDKDMPRQPWHDIHAALQGPAAWNFVQEFIGRWTQDPALGSTLGDKPRYTSDADTQHQLLWSDRDPLWQHYVKLRKQWKGVLVQPGEAIPRGPWTATVCRSIEQAHWGVRTRENKDLAKDFNMRSPHEKSIQTAYTQAIESAEKFIYIETQYLVGSSAKWIGEKTKLFANDLPGTIVGTILKRAREKKEFHVYILIPMLPEGRPTGSTKFSKEKGFSKVKTTTTDTTVIRRLNWKTLEYMIVTLESELKKIDQTSSWQQYLSFYFLADWKAQPTQSWVLIDWSFKEEEKLKEMKSREKQLQNSINSQREEIRKITASSNAAILRAGTVQEMQRIQQEAARKFQELRKEVTRLELERIELADKIKAEEKALNKARTSERSSENRRKRVRSHDRYMIYVHSKMMIVDDTQIIVGSANLNERSLAGDRDTEIACLLRANANASDRKACEDRIREFRMKQVWSEHFGGTLPPESAKPNSKACTEAIKKTALANYHNFRSMSAAPAGHLCRWPFKLSNGRLAIEDTMFTETGNLLPDAGSPEDEWKWSCPGVEFDGWIESLLADRSG